MLFETLADLNIQYHICSIVHSRTKVHGVCFVCSTRVPLILLTEVWLACRVPHVQLALLLSLWQKSDYHAKYHMFNSRCSCLCDRSLTTMQSTICSTRLALVLVTEVWLACTVLHAVQLAWFLSLWQKPDWHAHYHILFNSSYSYPWDSSLMSKLNITCYETCTALIILVVFRLVITAHLQYNRIEIYCLMHITTVYDETSHFASFLLYWNSLHKNLSWLTNCNLQFNILLCFSELALIFIQLILCDGCSSVILRIIQIWTFISSLYSNLTVYN
jgi:hypothetical protein